MKKYELICSDPPWRFADKLTMSEVKRGADAQYSTMALRDIVSLPVREIIAENAVLALWAPSSMLLDGLRVMEAWGFQQKQIYTWMKATRSPRPPQPKSFANAYEAWRECLDASGLDDYDAAKEDAAWVAWKRREGQKPEPFEGGHFDEINQLLNLEGRERVTGGLEAFWLLMGKSRSWIDAPAAITLLKNVPGLEGLRLPDEIQEHLILSEEIENRGWLEAKQAFGMGYHFRGCTEHALLGTRGKVKPVSRAQRNAHLSPALKHSQKPEEFQDRLDAMYPAANKLEMFARRKREGWTCVGNECEGTLGLDIRDWFKAQLSEASAA